MDDPVTGGHRFNVTVHLPILRLSGKKPEGKPFIYKTASKLRRKVYQTGKANILQRLRNQIEDSATNTISWDYHTYHQKTTGF